MPLLVASHITSNAAGGRGGGIRDRSGRAHAVTLRRGASVTGNTPDDCVGNAAC